MSGERVLVADDDPLSREFLEEALAAMDLEVEGAADGEKAISRLWQGEYDLVVTDLKMPGADGIDVLHAARALEPPVPVVLVTAHGTVEVAVAAMRDGADDFLIKPASPEQIEMVVRRFREKQRLAAENRYLRQELSNDTSIVVDSPAMQGVMELADRVAHSKATVLITGESGVGKEVVANRIHNLSSRVNEPFIRLNCAALAGELLASELFGHEKGAFTGAVSRKDGRFSLADGGTLLLDEIAETNQGFQKNLLRVLESEQFERVGGSKTISVDVRVIAATNRDLAAEVEAGNFRKDLYYRLNVFPIHVPPLRDRVEDIPSLIESAVQRALKAGGSKVHSVDAEAIDILSDYSWPGNVRELLNLVQRAVLVTEGETLSPGVVKSLLGMDTIPLPQPVANGVSQAANLVGKSAAQVEKELIQQTLEHCLGSREKAARMLGLSTRTLRNRLRSWRGDLLPCRD